MGEVNVHSDMRASATSTTYGQSNRKNILDRATGVAICGSSRIFASASITIAIYTKEPWVRPPPSRLPGVAKCGSSRVYSNTGLPGVGVCIRRPPPRPTGKNMKDIGQVNGCSDMREKLAFTRYSFTSKLYCGSQLSLYCPPPSIYKAYPIAILLHDHCSIYAPPSTPLLYVTYHTILVMGLTLAHRTACISHLHDLRAKK